MKSLLLLRHAQSATQEQGQSDFDRLLTEEGEQKAIQVGERLLSTNTIPDLIISSTAMRAQATAHLVAEKLNIVVKVVSNPSIYNSTHPTLVQVIKELDESYRQILLVGHNPAITTFGEFIIGQRIRSLEPASLLQIKMEIKNWKDITQGCGRLILRIA